MGIMQQSTDEEIKDNAIYRNRWRVEMVFSCLKRTFEEYVYSVNLKNMIQERMLKASLYNKIISV